MGSGTSKDPSPATSGPRRLRSWAFGASCFGLSSSLPHDPDYDDVEEDKTGSSKGGSSRRTDGVEIKSSREISERSRRHRKMPPLSLDADRNGIHRKSSSSSNADATISSSSLSRSRSRFGFIPDRIGSRLSRAMSLGSSRAQSLFPETSCDDVHNQNENEENFVDAAENDAAVDHSSHRNHVESVNNEIRRYNHSQLEGSVRFSRTLSVGRLRDRVLRRSSSTTLTLAPALVEDRSATEYNVQVSDIQGLGGRRRLLPYDIGSFTESGYDTENGSLHLRGGNSHDLLEHRSAFLERRRRIRSQVRALQRLGSRFENLSGHERSCILSGQHRTGRCTCRATARVESNSNDESGTRASLSRIVMLAEALFEVLDEIHQQSVALNSRPSLSSIGSVPAPKEVVECMPVKVYTKPQKQQHEEVAQCYICLVEYEDGDFMRMLPCNHEFHQKCIDKWLKEIHRVCPLCRGDVCRTEVSGTDKIS